MKSILMHTNEKLKSTTVEVLQETGSDGTVRPFCEDSNEALTDGDEEKLQCEVYF